MIQNRVLLTCSRLITPTSRNVLVGSLSQRGLISGYTLNNTTTSQLQQQQQIRNYATFGEKQFQKIKAKRDEAARLLKEEAEQKFIEENKVSIETLSFEEALQNLKGKLLKYKVVSAPHMATLFKKVTTSEQLDEALLFYKSLKNDDPKYFNGNHLSQIYYAADRCGQWKMWADIVSNPHTFQMFPSHLSVAKTIYQLLRNGDTDKAIELFKYHQKLNKITKHFISALARGLNKTKQSLAAVPLLQAIETTNVHSGLIKDILRESIKQGNTEQVLADIGRFIQVVFDNTSDKIICPGVVYAAQMASGNNALVLPSQVEVNEKIVDVAAKTILQKLKEISPEAQQTLIENVKNYFGGDANVPKTILPVLEIQQQEPEKQQESKEDEEEEKEEKQ
ncbi:hypothetical protein SAMD00019534_054720 [Acytostelium subglobosum LB1]|uniref:hypothetical protein n=1 Tax=Acytostelium subglobosum LB1 TaxID=1410327 RepID=UPI000644F997|nr:hypothetical protein SAMD00019534_054720 [Acytostelium subglobosum LB1]GAM22297.1 hypothetical protein SAMD00019534_054720 [Acytostelium subglobosum LB1]|eukprot:XP_012754417.1 hypothetical protein SAMD00019534_054720 [Acytostelium subglobosum LB1]